MDEQHRESAAASFTDVTDPRRMGEVVASHLAAPGFPPLEVVTCEVSFARRGEARSLFQYRLGLRDPNDGQTVVREVTAVRYGGRRTVRAWDRIRGRLPAPAGAGLGLVPAAYVPELDLLLQVFPFDHQMPALAPILEGPWPPLAEALLADQGPGTWRIERWEAEAIRYRVDLRATIRLVIRSEEVGTGRMVERRYFAKTYANPSLAARAWQGQRDLERVLGASERGLAVAPIAAWLPDDRVLVQREVAGTALLDALADPSAAGQVVRRAARALAALHQLPVVAPPQAHDLERVGPERVRRNAARLREARPDLGDRVDAVEAGILATWRDADDDAPSAPVHGDLKPAHVLLDGEHVVLLDFDKFAVGDPMLDLVNLSRGLGMGRAGRKSGGASDPSAAFIDEYLARVPAAWARRLAPNLAAALLADAGKVDRRVRQDANHRRRREDGDRAATLIDEATTVIARSVS